MEELLSNPLRSTSSDQIAGGPRRPWLASILDAISSRRRQALVLPPPMLLALVFVALTSIGTLLLLLPFTSQQGGFTPFLDALFTATSATTATGLSVHDVSTFWTRPGQSLVLAATFVGGLSFMVIATALLMNVGQRSPGALPGEIGGTIGSQSVLRLTIRVASIVVGIQLFGMIAFFARFSFLDSPLEALWTAFSQSVSAFNNAGLFDVAGVQDVGSLQSEWFSIAVVGILIVLGSVGWLVIIEVGQRRRWGTLSLNTKLVIATTISLIVVGTVLVLVSEFNNSTTLGGLPFLDKLGVSVFESISGRTAGFETISYSHTEQHTNFFMTGLMLIGGASASVAGGFKINTLAILVVAVFSVVAGRTNASVFSREIPFPQIQRAMTLCILMITVAFVSVMLLTFSERDQGFAFNDVMFEAVSAISTSGLSTGITPELTSWGKVIIIVAMLVGRILPLSLVVIMIDRIKRESFLYPTERVTIG